MSVDDPHRIPTETTETETIAPSPFDLDPRVQFGLAAGVLLVLLGALALPWVEFDQASGGGTSFGLNELRQAFGDADGIESLLGKWWAWLAAGVYGLGYGMASLMAPEPTERMFLPAVPLALTLVMLWRVNHYLADAAGVFILSGVDAQVGSGGIVTACGCAVVLGTVIWGHQIADASRP